MNQVAELLEKAADALESGRIPWGKYDANLYKPPGVWCAAETIGIVGDELGLQTNRFSIPILGMEPDAVCLAQEAVSMHVTKGRDRGHLTSWNDTPARTLDEVVQAFKETAKEIRNQAS